MVSFFDVTLPDCKNDMSFFGWGRNSLQSEIAREETDGGFFSPDLTYVSFYLLRVITGVISFFLGVSRIHDRQGQPKKKC